MLQAGYHLQLNLILFVMIVIKRLKKMTDSEIIQEYANQMILLMTRMDTLEDMVASLDVRLEQIEKVME